MTLTIAPELFKEGYDLDFTPYIETDYTGITYLPWSNALVLLRKLHPGLEVGFETDEYLQNNAIPNSVEAMIKNTERQLENNPDSKTKKKLQNAYRDAIELYTFADRGVAVFPYLYDAEGHTSTVLYFPVMDSTNRFIPSPTSRDISDAKVRAAVKVIAWVTGIGLRLWSREDMDVRKNDNNHPKFKGLQVKY